MPRQCCYCKINFNENRWAWNSYSRRCENCYQYGLKYQEGKQKQIDNEKTESK